MQERAKTHARVGSDLCKSGQRLMREWAENHARVGRESCESGQRLVREWAETCARVGRDLESGQRLMREWAETYARVDTDFSNNERRTFPSFPCKRESIFSYPYNPSPAGDKPPRYANTPLPPHSPRELAAVPAKTHRISRRHSRANGNPSSLTLSALPLRGMTLAQHHAQRCLRH